MSLHYVWEKFYVAVDALAIYEDTVQNRLYNGYISALIRLENEDIPPDMLEKYLAIKAGIERSHPTATLSLSNEEATELAGRIVEFYTEVVRRQTIEDYEQDQGFS